jgi:stearoyl-CoA desaturase (Delta-9 desaturase)
MMAIKRVKNFRKKALPAAGILLAHLLPFTLFFTGTRTKDWIAFAIMFVLVNYALGLSLHRYFAHHSFQTSRWFQFCLAWLSCSVFGDPIGFAGKHRLHHRFADTEDDVHSPAQGWWHCCIGSLLDDGRTEEEILRSARDWTRFPELLWLHRYYYVPAWTLAVLLFAIGGYRMFVTGYVLGFLVAVHAPSAVNYFCHLGDNRRFQTPDRSTNNWFLGLVLFGEGWHNNHHRYPVSARSGLSWYEFDLHYYTCLALKKAGLIWGLRAAPVAGANATRRLPVVSGRNLEKGPA